MLFHLILTTTSWNRTITINPNLQLQKWILGFSLFPKVTTNTVAARQWPFHHCISLKLHKHKDRNPESKQRTRKEKSGRQICKEATPQSRSLQQSKAQENSERIRQVQDVFKKSLGQKNLLQIIILFLSLYKSISSTLQIDSQRQ